MKKGLCLIIILFIFFITSFVSALCIDSDGRNYDIKGSVSETGFFKNTKTDYCRNNLFRKTNKLNEFNCENNEIKSEIIECPYGCEDGACISYEKYLEKQKIKEEEKERFLKHLYDFN